MTNSLLNHQANVITAVKSSNSIYLNMNKLTTKLLGWKNIEDCIGKSDYDLPCDASTFAHAFIEQDKKALYSNKSILTLDIQNYKLGWKTLLTNKIPLNNHSQISSGLFIQCIDITNTIWGRYYYGLVQSDNFFHAKNCSGATYVLNSDHCPIGLTQKQQSCLYHIIRGKSEKEIAVILKLSTKNIEDSISIIKQRLKCSTRQEMIEKAIDSGFLHYLPHQDSFNLLTSETNETIKKYNLTKRELICLFYLLKGRTAKEIANALSLSQRTIENRIYIIKQKLNYKTRSELIDKAIKEGFNNITIKQYQ